MRILQIITRSEAGGAQTVVRTLAEGLADRGCTVAIASGPEGSGEAWADLPKTIERITLPHLVRRLAPWADLQALLDIAALYKSWKPDIVHVHTSKAAALGRLAWGLPPSRIVYTMHGYEQLKIANPKFLALDALLKKRCGAIVAVSKHDLAQMRRDGYSPVYIPNGVSAPRRKASLPDTARSKIDEIRKKALPIALMIARNAPPKRPDILRQAAQLLTSTLHVLWIGGEPSTADPPNFFALGTVPDASALLYAADIYVLISDHEGMPVSILEAFSAALPVVASRVGGIPQLLGLEENIPSGDKKSQPYTETARGVLVANNPEALAHALAVLATDTDKRATMGAAARASWQNEYSANHMVEHYQQLYAELLRAPG